MKNRKVLILTYYWPPAGGPGVQRWLKFTKYMPEYGFDPVVITVDPEKAEYPLRDESLVRGINPDLDVQHTDCSGLYEFYKKFTKAQSAPYSGFVNEHNPNLKQKIARFIRGNFFLPDARRGWNRHAYERAMELIRQYSIDTVITTGPPMSTHLVGMKIRQAAGCRWIADFRDPWTDIYYYREMYPTWAARKIDAGYERRVLISADAVITVSAYIKGQLASKSERIAPDKIKVIPNGYDEEDFTGECRKEDVFTMAYTGTMSSSYTIDALLEAISRNVGRFPMKIQFVGKISSDIADKIRKFLPESVEFISPVPHRESIQYLRKSSLLLLIIPNMPGNEGNLTGKLFEYLGSGTPILCLGPPRGNAAEIIRECNAGKCFDYSDKDGISDFLGQQYARFTEKTGRPENPKLIAYSRRAQTQTLCEILNNHAN